MQSQKRFNGLLAGWAFAMTGDSLRMFALPLLAHFVSPTPAAVAAVAAFAALPWICVAIPAGAMVDRWDPVRVAVIGYLFRALACSAVVITTLNGSNSIAWLCVVAFALGAAETFTDGAAQSLILDTADPAHLEQANSRYVMVETVALDLVGPITAALAFAVNPWLPFVVAAGGFALGAMVMASVARGRGPSSAAPAAPLPREPLRAQIKVALRCLFTDRTLRTLVLTVAVLAAAKEAQDAVQPVYVTDNLHLPASFYPTLAAALSVGALIAAWLVVPVRKRVAPGRLMVGAMAGYAVTMLVIGLFPNPAVVWVAYLALGLAQGTWNVLSNARRQRHTPRAVAASVSSIFRVCAWGPMPLAAIGAGVIGDHLGVPVVSLCCAGVVVVLIAVVAPALVRAEPPSVNAAADEEATARPLPDPPLVPAPPE